ncbi:MAG: arsenite oxidase large subunit [Bradymonadia bacterium]|jgi:arsenite oxidase large subunit
MSERPPNTRPISRRTFGRALGAGAVAAALPGRAGANENALPVLQPSVIPPTSAKVQTTACAYCVVGCGYKVYTWPVGEMGGASAEENAFGVNFPVRPMAGYWVSPQMHNEVQIDGEPHHVVVLPDPEATVVNVGGNYSLGGSLARRLYNPDTPTADRFQFPQIRVGDDLVRITWEEATDLMARVSRHVLDTRGPLAWGMKTYSYQFYENTYAITKLAFDAVGTPCWAPHDSPLHGSDTPGLSDAGIDPFGASYQDWKDADVILVSGVSLYEAKAILFDDWVRPGGARLIVVDPRRSPTAEYALESGGLHLQLKPGTDALLCNALAWIIIDEGWADEEFIERWTARPDDIPARDSTDWRRARHALTYAEYVDFIRGEPLHVPELAAEETGVSVSQLYTAARYMAEPRPGGPPRTSLMLEKGNYWGFNYPNSASLVSLGLLVGAGNRPGRMIGRGGGHQRGMIAGGHYPYERSPDRIAGQPVGLNLDRWAAEGNLAFAWAIGCTWAAGGTTNASRLFSQMHAQARGAPDQLDASVFPNGLDGGLDVGLAAAILRRRVDAGGLVFVQQDIYPQTLTELADLVLPAASWGEDRFSRMNGERRLRTYAHICDAPGEAKSDWWIVARFAQDMGYEGFDWQTSADLFEEAGLHSAKAHDYRAVIELARDLGQSPVALVEAMGTTGIQCPVVRDGDTLRGTVRLHSDGFNTKTKRAFFVRGSYTMATRQRERLAPRDGEHWVINRRASTVWSAMIEDLRNPFRMAQLPNNPIQMHPDDARASGLEHGDAVRVVRTDPDGSFEGVLDVTDAVRPGVVCTYFNFTGDLRYAANNVTSSEGDPVSGKVPFKLGRGRVERIEDGR